jgi:hypothetical protein
MAAQRKVKRTASGKQGTVKAYNDTGALTLPGWAREIVVAWVPYVALVLAVWLSWLSVLAAVLGFSALPLPWLNKAAVDTGVGLSAALIIIEFILVALSVRPLFARLTKGWNLFVAFVVVHGVYDFVQQSYLGAVLVTAISLYLLFQVRHYYNRA